MGVTSPGFIVQIVLVSKKWFFIPPDPQDSMSCRWFVVPSVGSVDLGLIEQDGLVHFFFVQVMKE